MVCIFESAPQYQVNYKNLKIVNMLSLGEGMHSKTSSCMFFYYSMCGSDSASMLQHDKNAVYFVLSETQIQDTSCLLVSFA